MNIHRCGNGFARYNKILSAHSSRCGNNYGSVFNITNNCSGNHGGFWGGFGMGLGLGFGNLFGGMFGMGNMFGGFGFGNMFGMGNMFGFGNPYQTGWSNNNNSGSCNCSCGSKPSTANSSSTGTSNTTGTGNANGTENADGTGNANGTDNGTGTVTEKTINIGGTNVKISDLTKAQLEDLNKTQIKDLISKIDADQAKDLIEKLGLNCKLSNGNDGVKATTSLVGLNLADKAGLPLAAGHNTKLSAANGQFPYIHGTISEVEYNDSTQEITFTLTDDKAVYAMKCKAGDTILKVVEEKSSIDPNYDTITPNTEYTIGTGDYATREGAPAKRSKTATT